MAKGNECMRKQWTRESVGITGWKSGAKEWNG